MKTRIYSRQVAKTPSSESFFLPLRLCVFARDIPAFGCGFAALSLYGEFFSTGNPE
jgi:hypothetical protein